MRLRLFSSFAALLLLAACETAGTGEGEAGGFGEGTTTTTTPVASQPAPAQATQPAPAGPTPGSAEHLVAEVGDRVFFDFDKYDLKPGARDTLREQANWLKQFPSVTVTIEGHCDERGTREYNLALGERRAASVKDYLAGLGISTSRIATISYGKERPEAEGHIESAWSQNRRGVMVVN